ncbi:hypothetical protein Halha_1542 [Halobacteroides halobius DSM 5150]|uniref:Uncharacterized protein n=1 Tax=Halobacteroides halobius (strain ATCC 35273 / DSM 5150 / MD-1) TaxID=748449 RepID=L0K8Y6_HALHC|nr:hypothetical protein [Halobacteroides halobius]AGB41481.1 hypothetical protein Halha_1542 [Halobacteroides halobius DSM 5150]
MSKWKYALIMLGLSLLIIMVGGNKVIANHEHDLVDAAPWIIGKDSEEHWYYTADKVCSISNCDYIEGVDKTGKAHSKKYGSWSSKSGDDTYHYRKVECTASTSLNSCSWENEEKEKHTYKYDSSIEKDKCTVCGHTRPNSSHEASKESENLTEEGKEKVRTAKNKTEKSNNKSDEGEEKKRTKIQK